MKHVAGYSDLSEKLKNKFDTTYRQHLYSLPLNERANLAETEIEKIEPIMIEASMSLLKVYFRHGDCYFYLPGNVWKKVT